MGRIASAVLFAVLGYVVGGFGGGLMVWAFSSNTHDRSLEASMTGAFVFGPLVAILGGIFGFVRGASRRGGGTRS